jgi:hypothetical protein
VTRLSLSGHILPDNSIHQIFKVVSTHLKLSQYELICPFTVKIQEKTSQMACQPSSRLHTYEPQLRVPSSMELGHHIGGGACELHTYCSSGEDCGSLPQHSQLLVN